MAEPVGRLSAVQMLEDAVHLLRQAGPRTLLCFWIGGVPMVLGALRFWNDVTNPRTPDLVCLAESFVLALLLIWMNCWRAVFAGRLRRQMSGAADGPWTRPRIWRLIALQTFLGASRLVILPAAFLVGFPLATVMAFYRDAASLSDLGMDPLEAIRQARKSAKRHTGQTWTMTALLFPLGVAVMLNVFLTLALMPQLVKMLTGYESVFSRGGQYFLANGMFAGSVAALTWLAFDPYVQAAFGIRGYRADSAETGEDLRAELRSLRATAVTLAVIFAMMPVSKAAVSTEELRSASREAMAQREYDWRLPPPANVSYEKPWLVDLTDRVIAGIRKALDFIGDWIGRFFRWLNDRFARHLVPGNGAPPAGGFRWTIAIFAALACLASGWIVWHKRRLRRAALKPAGSPIAAIRLDDDLPADRLPEEDWLSTAERFLAEGDSRSAVRALYLANLAWLGRREWIAIHPGKTNREYEADLRRRTRQFPTARDLFSANIRSYERVWYGSHHASAEEVDRFRTRMAGLKSLGEAA